MLGLIALLGFLAIATYMISQSAQHVANQMSGPERSTAVATPVVVLRAQPTQPAGPEPAPPPVRPEDLDPVPPVGAQPPQTYEVVELPSQQEQFAGIQAQLARLAEQVEAQQTALNTLQQNVNQLLQANKNAQSKAHEDRQARIARQQELRVQIDNTRREIEETRNRIKTIRANPLNYEPMTALPPLQNKVEQETERLIRLQNESLENAQEQMQADQ